MHSIDPYADLSAPRTKLRATLRQLHGHLKVNQNREQAALEFFGNWQARWSDHRELIAQQLEWLDRELSQLKTSAVPGPYLSLLSPATEEESPADGMGDGSESHAQDDHDSGIISSQADIWNSAHFPR